MRTEMRQSAYWVSHATLLEVQEAHVAFAANGWSAEVRRSCAPEGGRSQVLEGPFSAVSTSNVSFDLNVSMFSRSTRLTRVCTVPNINCAVVRIISQLPYCFLF